MAQSEDTAATPESSGSQRGRWINRVLAAVGLLGVALGLTMWAISSPAGASPDDDYHLGSIWCPWPVESSGCDYREEDGQIVAVTVPESVARASACYAFHPEVSAACQDGLDDSTLSETRRFDDGTYPPGYYKFHSLFVGPNVFDSIVNMRIVNVVIGLGTTALVAAFADRRMRYTMFVAAIAAWIPMGVYFIASNNPSSWAITGTFVYGSALLASTRTSGWRRWTELGLMTAGAIMAATSRADAAFFLLIVTLAIWVLVPINRQQRVPLLWSIGTTMFGLVMFRIANQADSLTNTVGWPADLEASKLHVFIANLRSIPDYFVGFWGINAGPGWFDTTLEGWSTYSMVLVAGALIFAGSQSVSLRKGLSALVLLGSIVGVPVVSMTLRNVHPVNYYQPRYMLPLLAVFFTVWILSNRGKPLFGTGLQLTFLVILASVSNALALRKVIERVSIGEGELVDIAQGTWWPWALSTGGTTVLGAVAMGFGLVALAVLVTRGISGTLPDTDCLGEREPGCVLEAGDA